MEELPAIGESIYFWMWRQGLKHIPWQDIVSAIAKSEHRIRPKDSANYWRGYYKSDLYTGQYNVSMINPGNDITIRPYDTMAYHDYPSHPYINMPEIDNRYVPCNKDGIPLIKWSEGCYTKSDAESFWNAKYIGENLKGCKHIVFDIDGDHNGNLFTDTIEMFKPFIATTHAMIKPTSDRSITSYHLTFRVDRIIPTMHFSKAHVDIIGNKMNSIRYFKNKIWNKVEPIVMTDDIWETLKQKILWLEKKDADI